MWESWGEQKGNNKINFLPIREGGVWEEEIAEDAAEAVESVEDEVEEETEELEESAEDDDFEEESESDEEEASDEDDSEDDEESDDEYTQVRSNDQHKDPLQWLGLDALWASPSPWVRRSSYQQWSHTVYALTYLPNLQLSRYLSELIVS